MRLRLWAALLLGSLLVAVVGAAPATAQFDLRALFGYGDPPPAQRPPPMRRGDPYGPRGGYHQQAPASRGPYYPGMPVYPPEARRPYAYPDEYRRPVQPRREIRRPSYSERAERRRRSRAAPSTPARTQDKPEPQVEPSTFVVMFGDALAELVAQGLEDAYEDVDEVEVVGKARGDSGLSRPDVYDWPKVIQDYLASNPRITVAVVMLGANDRQPIREGEATFDPLSDRWREIYRDRVDAVVRAFAERKIPLVWVGTPPMKNDKFSADLIVMNEIYRDRVQKAGGVYVDIWQGFVNDENRYAAVGPDVDGQTARLRANDGVSFTRAGARKAAHFVEIELKRLIEQKGAGAAVASLPKAPDTPASPQSIDQLINASIPALPEPPGLPSLPAKPVAGPVLPLTRAETSSGGALLSGRPAFDGDAAYTVDRALKQGIAPAPKPGRADDFTWPPPS